jgi:hypothetical protein
MTTCSTPKMLSASGDNAERIAFIKMKKCIESLGSYIRGKTNVHIPIKEAIGQLTISLREFEDCRADCGNVVRMDKATQSEATREAPLETPNQSLAHADPDPVGGDAESNPEKKWTDVVRKKKPAAHRKREAEKRKPDVVTPRRKIEPKHRLDAIVVKTNDGSQSSYAQALQKIKKEVAIPDSQIEVHSIRRTKAGELMLQLKKGSTQTERLVKEITGALGEGATVRKLVPTCAIEIRDLDSGADEKEVLDALNSAVAGVLEEGQAKVKSLRPAYGGTQLAVVTMPANAAQAVLGCGKIRVGWVNCRVRQRIHLTRCFRCHEFGHLAADCKGKENRAAMCLACGRAGHKAKECKNKPHCMLCSQKPGNSDVNHQATSGKCPAFRAALERARKNQK